MRLLSRVLAPKTKPKSTQYRKRHSKIGIAIDLRFFIDFWSPRDSKMEAPKPTVPSQTLCFTAREQKPTFWTRSDLWIDVGPLLASFWHHLGWKIEENRITSKPNPLQKTIVFLIAFLIDLWTILVQNATTFSWRRRPFFDQNRIPAPDLAIWAPP